MDDPQIKLLVVRCSDPTKGPDYLVIYRGGVLILEAPMGPSGPLYPKDAWEARSRPWFYTTSPHGEEILELARRRGLTIKDPG